MIQLLLVAIGYFYSWCLQITLSWFDSSETTIIPQPVFRHLVVLRP